MQTARTKTCNEDTDATDNERDAALFDVTASVGAYGSRNVQYDIPDYIRGPRRTCTTTLEDAAAPAWWWSEAEQVVMDIISINGKVSSDDLHEHYADEPSATGAAFGGLFSRMANAGKLVEVGMTKSRRPEARKRRIIVWAAP